MRKIRTPHLNGEILYKQYFAMGQAATISRLARWALAEGMAKPIKTQKNNRDGLPCMSVWKAMWRWASLQENQITAFVIFKDYVREYGWEIDTDFSWPAGTDIFWNDWKPFMLKKIRTAYQYKKESYYNRFLQQNGWAV